MCLERKAVLNFLLRPLYFSYLIALARTPPAPAPARQHLIESRPGPISEDGRWHPRRTRCFVATLCGGRTCLPSSSSVR